MKKLEMYTIYSIANGDLAKTDWTETELLDREINLQANNLIRKYLRFKGLEEKDQFIENIIKVMLPYNKNDEDNETPLKVLNDGITFRDKKFIPLVSSPNMMKQEGEDDYHDEKFKCEYIFVAEEDKNFVRIFEDITSAGKLIEKQENKAKISFNKDVIARLALNTSSSYKINYNANIVILPSDTYEYTANYCYFSNEDYGELKYDTITKKHEFQDGCGLMSSKMAEIIQRDMKVDYPVDFAIIRQDPLAIKGLVVKVDFNKFFENEYAQNTPYFVKTEDGFYTKDYFGEWVDISKADLIINTNMAKWAKWWKKEEPVNIIKEVKNELSKEKYNNYRDLLNCLYVTKINKQEPRKYSLANYQLISNLTLTPKELDQLQQETNNMYSRVLDMNINAIRLLMNDIAVEGKEELGTIDKVHYLLQSTEDALLMPSVRQQVIRMVRKKINLLAQGKFYVKGHYKMASSCPITFMDWIMFRDLSQCNRGLGVSEYYVPKESGKRVISRNPLNSFSEIHRVEIARNELLEEYCGNLTNELAFFNQKDDTFMLSSGQDEDGDCNFWVDNDVIYNAVIEPENGYNFCNIEDTKDTVEHEYTKENEYYCAIKGSGNLIGAIANIGAKISTLCTEIGYYSPSKDVTYGYKELEEGYCIAKADEIEKLQEVIRVKDLKSQISACETELDEFGYIFSEEEKFEKECYIQVIEEQLYYARKDEKKKKRELFTIALEEKVNKGDLIPMDTLEEEQIKSLLIKQFYRYKAQSYCALQLQMLAIDIPKTLKDIDKDKIKSLKKSVSEKDNPVFMKYAMPWENKKNKHFSNTHSVLNLHAKNIAKTLMTDLHNVKEDIDNYSKADRVGCMNLILSKAQPTHKTEEAIPLVKAIFNSWRNEAERIRSEYKDNKPKKNEELRKNNLYTSKSFMVLSSRYDLNTMASALLGMSKSTNSAVRTKFMIDCCFNIIQQLLDIYYNDITIFKEEENGEYDWMFKKYNKINTVRREMDLQAMEIKREQIRQKEIIEIKFRPIDLDCKQVISKKDDKFYINNKPIFNNKITGKKGVMTFDLLDKLLEDKTELEVVLKDIDHNKPTYIIAYIPSINA